MLAIERQKWILEMLEERGSLRTAETAGELGVTDETVRRDFEQLEKRGKLLRMHGGASRVIAGRGELPLNERQLIHRDEKRAIARIAAKRIQPNETIFIDASSTVLTLLEFLPEVPLTILTNAMNVFEALSGRADLDLICTGGLFEAKSRSFIGLTAETALRRYHIHRMFFSGDGLDLVRGVSESNSRQAAFKERVIEVAGDVVLLADHSKLGRKASFFFAGLGKIGTLVTDGAADPATLETLREAGLEVTVG